MIFPFSKANKLYRENYRLFLSLHSAFYDVIFNPALAASLTWSQ